MTIRERIEAMEKETLSPYACLSVNTKGRDQEEDECDIRPVFTRDRDRILHSKSFVLSQSSTGLLHLSSVIFSPRFLLKIPFYSVIRS